jgi:outer membrane protein assembly factor BamE
MRMLRSASRSASSRAATLTLCLAALSAGLVGCASKNPLMDEAPAVARTQPATAPAAEKPALSAAGSTTESAEEIASANSGVHTIKTRRFLGIFSPYRVDVQQGNFVSKEMLAQLKEGMTPEQVQFALGTPLLHDIFHANRWDYLFRLQKRNGEVTTSRVTVFFENKRMVRYEGGNLPSEEAYLAQIAGKPPKAAADTAPATPKAPPATKE